MANPTLVYCSVEKKACIGWVEAFFKDCLCNLKDEISFGCGLLSLVCWAVAEIPQIITNFINKSGHGVSLAFLLTWIAGDIFNLVGCLLEPATLPTQFYTALLYTISTVVLVLQCVYYDYICRWWKCRKNHEFDSKVEEDIKKPLKPSTVSSSIVIPSAPPTRDLYYTSARSLANSGTPPIGSYLRPVRSGPSALENINSSSDDETLVPVSSKKRSKKSKKISQSAGYGTFIATCVTLPVQSKGLMEGYMGLSGRRLLLDNGTKNEVFGVWLGWMMAAIYMGGRIPQIWLNIKRGSVEGLNPLMFIFALIANVAYVGSILVRSTEWEKIKPNMPWLMDAIVCVGLDLFIILQYAYYRLRERRTKSNGQDSGEYYVTSEK